MRRKPPIIMGTIIAATTIITTITDIIMATTDTKTDFRVTGMTALDPKTERRCRDSFARQQAMAAIGASVLSSRGAATSSSSMPFDGDASPSSTASSMRASITTLGDTACGFAALSLMPEDAAVLTTEFKVNLLSPAKGERLVARRQGGAAGQEADGLPGRGVRRGRPAGASRSP